MEQVDKALVISLGIKGAELSENISVEEDEVSEKQQETISMFQYMGQQMRFWQDIEVKASLIKTKIARLDEQINSVLNYIEETNQNSIKVADERIRETNKITFVKELMEGV